MSRWSRAGGGWRWLDFFPSDPQVPSELIVLLAVALVLSFFAVGMAHRLLRTEEAVAVGEHHPAFSSARVRRAAGAHRPDADYRARPGAGGHVGEGVVIAVEW